MSCDDTLSKTVRSVFPAQRTIISLLIIRMITALTGSPAPALPTAMIANKKIMVSEGACVDVGQTLSL